MPTEFDFLPAFLVDAHGQMIGAIQEIPDFTTTTDDVVSSVFNPVMISNNQTYSFTFSRATRGYRQLKRELYGWMAKGPIRWKGICKALRRSR